MSTTDLIKVNGPTAVLGTIPVVLGFHPEDSLVLVGLSGPQRRVGPIARVDLSSVDSTCVRQLGAMLAPHAGSVIAVLYGHGTDVVERHLRRDLGLEVFDILRVSNQARHVHAPVAEAAAINGRAVLPDRAAVRASIEHHPGTATDGTRSAATQFAGPEGRDRYLVDRMTDAPAAVTELISAAQAAKDTDPACADLCAALAVLAYRTGDGALAQVAIDRTLRIDPDHRLAHLTLHLISCGVGPEEVGRIVA